jgi:hypothetical protein
MSSTTHIYVSPKGRPWMKQRPRKPRKSYDGMQLYWLDFHRPEDGACLGSCVVPGPTGDDGFIEAVKIAHHYKVNLGGQCQWVEVPNLDRAPREYLAKLLTADEVVTVMAIIRREKLT